jgi:cyclic pyranopterin monophosphate synthase
VVPADRRMGPRHDKRWPNLSSEFGVLSSYISILYPSKIVMSKQSQKNLSHIDEEGRIKMVDVGDKSATRRTAEASGVVKLSPETVAAIRERRTKKGDPLETARLAGIMGAKRTSELIPLCHPLALTHIDVQITLGDDGAQITATASTTAQTGVEMEALTAVSVTALTLYDMCKAIDRSMTISDIRLERKIGGRSGEWRRETS